MNESRIVALVCAPLALDDPDIPKPLTPAKWADLRDAANQDDFGGVEKIVGLDATDLAEKLNIEAAEADRLVRLLDRGDVIDGECERLAELGIWMMTQGDPDYPDILTRRLRRQAPPVLFGLGDKDRLREGGLAVIGSRSIDHDGRHYAQQVAEACAHQGLPVISGAARGVDQIAMSSALIEGGRVLGVVPDSLEERAVSTETRGAVEEGGLTLVCPHNPAAPFHVGLAMGRNKVIYALADWGLVVRCDRGKGGSWSGAVEALRVGEPAVFVRDNDPADDGGGARELMRRGAIAFPKPPWTDLRGDLDSLVAEAPPRFEQEELF